MRNMLRLNLEALAVESFDTLPGARAPRGTVMAYDTYTEPEEPNSIVNTCECPGGPASPGSAQTYCGYATCGQDSCYATNCMDTCDNCPQEPATPFSPC
ncbi:MAG TPA: hypothetical protein VFS20_03430 [Longimicrobium sp.]|nr:hypothetical protein [Longimicrobium sp.]